MALTLESLKPIHPKYDYKYTNRPREACSTYLSRKNPFNLLPGNYKPDEGDVAPKFIDWKGKSRGLFFHHPGGKANVTCVKLSEDCKSPPPVICRERTKTRCTQTRYRESSAQTRSYQPEIAGDKENYENFEVYEISKLLDSFVPPGEYEAKVVERHRRRRKYEKALELTKNDPVKHHTVLEAMEWDEWVAREEDIQGCQMVRMEIVMKMFEERQEKLRFNSEQRILCSAERIQAKRASQLKKINVEYSRGVRRLEGEKQKITRSYRKGNITQEHINPASDLHAPQMRFGVNPNRRHFVGFRKKFDDRINDLDKQKDERGLASLICPFSKLKSWAKPKEQMKEVSQRFCSDENLKNLYESLRRLRTESEALKWTPKCLKKKVKVSQRDSGEPIKTTTPKPSEKSHTGRDEAKVGCAGDYYSKLSSEELAKNLRHRRAKELSVKTAREIASVVGHFEGKTMGRLLQFLSDELQRLQLQKKFQAIYMLAERERWRREAIEAGLRQKENKRRDDYEELYQAASNIHRDTASLFLQSVLEEEFKFTSEALAKERIEEIARDIDFQDIESIKLQGKEKRNYDRAIINDYVRNQVFPVVAAHTAKINKDKQDEANRAAIAEELHAELQKALEANYETPDSVSIVGDLLDDLMDDAVTYDFALFSPRSSDDEFETKLEVDEIINKIIKEAIRSPLNKETFVESTQFQNRLEGRIEFNAIMRKTIRRIIPEERWQHEAVRIVDQTISETLDDAVYEVECLKASRFVRANDRLGQVIAEIYKRFENMQTQEVRTSEETGDTWTSPGLKSIPSDFNIFDLASSTFESHEASTDERHSLRRIDYIDPSELHQFSPPEIGRRGERYDIMGDIRKLSEEPVNIFSDSSESTSSSDVNVIHYSNNCLHTTESKMFSSPWLATMHPELLVERQPTTSSSKKSVVKISEEHQSTQENLGRFASEYQLDHTNAGQIERRRSY